MSRFFLLLLCLLFLSGAPLSAQTPDGPPGGEYGDALPLNETPPPAPTMAHDEYYGGGIRPGDKAPAPPVMGSTELEQGPVEAEAIPPVDDEPVMEALLFSNAELDALVPLGFSMIRGLEATVPLGSVEGLPYYFTDHGHPTVYGPGLWEGEITYRLFGQHLSEIGVLSPERLVDTNGRYAGALNPRLRDFLATGTPQARRVARLIEKKAIIAVNPAHFSRKYFDRLYSHFQGLAATDHAGRLAAAWRAAEDYTLQCIALQEVIGRVVHVQTPAGLVETVVMSVFAPHHGAQDTLDPATGEVLVNRSLFDAANQAGIGFVSDFHVDFLAEHFGLSWSYGTGWQQRRADGSWGGLQGALPEIRIYYLGDDETSWRAAVPLS